MQHIISWVCVSAESLLTLLVIHLGSTSCPNRETGALTEPKVSQGIAPLCFACYAFMVKLRADIKQLFSLLLMAITGCYRTVQPFAHVCHRFNF